MKEAVIVSCARTAIGSFGASLKDIPVVKLGGLAINEAIKGRAFAHPKTRIKMSHRIPSAEKRIRNLKQSTMILTAV